MKVYEDVKDFDFEKLNRENLIEYFQKYISVKSRHFLKQFISSLVRNIKNSHKYEDYKNRICYYYNRVQIPFVFTNMIETENNRIIVREILISQLKTIYTLTDPEIRSVMSSETLKEALDTFFMNFLIDSEYSSNLKNQVINFFIDRAKEDKYNRSIYNEEK